MHPSSSSSFSSPSGGEEKDSYLPAGVYLQQDQTQQYLVQGRLMDDTIAPRPQRSLFSRVANAAAGAVIPSSSSSSSASLASQPIGSSSPSYQTHQTSRDFSSWSNPSEDLQSSSSSFCQKARIPPTHPSSSFLSHSSSSVIDSSYLSSSGVHAPPVGSSTSSTTASCFSSERLSPSSGFSGVHTPSHPPSCLGSGGGNGGGGGARVLPRSVEKVIESGQVKIEDINPEQAADISKALLLHQHQNHLLLHEKQQQLHKACQLQRTPLRYHPLSSPSTHEEERRQDGGAARGSSSSSTKRESTGSHTGDVREDEERRREEEERRRRYLGGKTDGNTTSKGVDPRRLQMPQPSGFSLSPEELEKSEEKGTRTLNIIREVFYEGLHSHPPFSRPPSSSSSRRSSSSATRGRGKEEEQDNKEHRESSSSSSRARRRGETSSDSQRGGFSSSEEEPIVRRETDDAAQYLDAVRQREEKEERERKIQEKEEEEDYRSAVKAQHRSTQDERKPRGRTFTSSPPPPPCRILLEGGQEGYQQQRGAEVYRKENEQEERETSSLLEEEEEEEESQMLEEIEARLKEDAEDFLHEAKVALDASRLTAEREVLALQYIPFKPDRLLHLTNSARESLLGVFVCLCLQHIEGLSSDIQSLVAEWSLIFLHTLASPQVLNVDASVEKSLVRPIVLRDQLLKDGLKTSDILTAAPLVKAVFQACDEMQPEINSIFNALHSQMSCYAATTPPGDTYDEHPPPPPPPPPPSSSSTASIKTSSSSPSTSSGSTPFPPPPPAEVSRTRTIRTENVASSLSSSSSSSFSGGEGEGRRGKRGSEAGGEGEEASNSIDCQFEGRHAASYEGSSSYLRVSEKREGKYGGGDEREDEKRMIRSQSSSSASSFSTTARRSGERGEKQEEEGAKTRRTETPREDDEEEEAAHRNLCCDGDFQKKSLIDEKRNRKTTDTGVPASLSHSSSCFSSSSAVHEEYMRHSESYPSPSSLPFKGGPHARYACERQGILLLSSSSSSVTRDSSSRHSGETIARARNPLKSEKEEEEENCKGSREKGTDKDERKKKTTDVAGEEEEEEEKISDRIRRRLEEERMKERQKQIDLTQENKKKEVEEEEKKKKEENMVKRKNKKTEDSDDIDTSAFQDVYSTEEELHQASSCKREGQASRQKEEEEEGKEQLLFHSRRGADKGKEEASLSPRDDGGRDGQSSEISSAEKKKKKMMMMKGRTDQEADGEKKKLSSGTEDRGDHSSSSSSGVVSFKAVEAHPLSCSSSSVDAPPRSFASSSSASRLSLLHPREGEPRKGTNEEEDQPGFICAVGSLEEHQEEEEEEEEEPDALLPSPSQPPSRPLLAVSSPQDRQADSGKLPRNDFFPAGSPSDTIKRRSEEESAAGEGDRTTTTRTRRTRRRASFQDLSSSIIMPVAPPSARTVLLRELTTSLVTSGSFDARVQLLLSQFASHILQLNPLVLVRLEHHLAADLLDLLKANTKEGARQKTWRRLKIAGAAIGGGVLVALTAGLAAPGIAAGIASLGLGGAGVSAFLASAGGMAVLVSLFGAGGAGLTGWKYSRRIANIKVFEFDMLNGKAPSSLCVTACVSGYLRTFDDISLPWMQALPHACSDLFSLKWEPNVLKALGTMVIQMLSQDFAVAAGKYYLQHTALGGLTFALFWPMALIQYASNLDNTWVLCRERAQQAGRLLADAISDTQAVGQRPVTLVGYSMGARVIFYCLQTLWKRRKLHVVCDCVLIGLPASLNTKQWTAARDVVSRRLVNVYSRSDWLLAFLYRWMEWGVQVAGLSPVRSVEGVENYDVTGLVKSHAQYPEKMSDILAFIGFDA